MAQASRTRWIPNGDYLKDLLANARQATSRLHLIGCFSCISEKPDPEQGTVRCGAGGTAPRVSWRSPLGPEKPDPEQGTVRCGAGGTAPRVSWRSPLGPGAHHLQSSNGGLF
ncbi:hypothetical protein CEXT_610121 [Caerostris extrusa]|uniref:Uncharacterized protein n=1 Tax=Caerostris extrusa TaxID=172846 RepID=A0AAV4Y0C8_CAEEX|nr:hypothetical protein CEXT_610121 [Caerostris extrusa]